MNRKLLGGLIALVAAFAALWFFVLRGDGGTKNEPANPAGRTGQIKSEIADKPKAQPARPAPRAMSANWTLDEDPEGHILLQGQVQGPDGKGIGGAKVWITSVPPRTTTSEDDGSFEFDKLVGRTYYLGATSGDMVGGPVGFKVTEKPDPVIIRIAEGATLIATVVDENDKPLEGASVKEGDDSDNVVKTNAEGKATIKPVRPGWLSVQASAEGYASAMAVTTIGSGGAVGNIKLTLKKGVAVSGKVIDEAGQPVAKARITVAPGLWGWSELRAQATSDEKGEFTLTALPAGSHILAAVDGEHAPSRSAPVTVGTQPVTGIIVTMKAGASLAGIVVDTKGKPVAAAAVRVAGKGADVWWRQQARQTTTDAEGKFSLRGLGRSPVQVRAESDTVASKVADVDLTDKADVKDLKLVLDVAGTISGIVVDDKGAPVAEIQVNSLPDFLSGAGNTDGMALTGMSSATTDGSGAFTLTGLVDGAYKVWAARSTDVWQEWGQNGIAAKTGDTNVRIVLPSPGEIKGTLVLDGGTSAPYPATVQVGTKPPTPVDKDGNFLVREVTPGAHDVTFQGSGFAQLVKQDVKVEPGKTTDLGKVTVARGRRLTGKVVDKSGTPVPGAKVKFGDMLFSAEGGNQTQAEQFETMAGVRSAVTDQSGQFTIIGVPKTAGNAIADHPDQGRSAGVQVAAGNDDPPPITLTLRGFGSITGKVTVKDKPASGVTVSHAIKGATGAATFTQTAEDGTFTMNKVPEGQIVVQAMQQQMMSMRSASTTVTVIAGKQTTANLAIPLGALALTVTVKAMPNNQVDAAQVFLFSGQVGFQDARQLTDGFMQGAAQGMKFWLGKDAPMPVFDELVAGDYSICTIPITGNLSDSTFQQRLQQNLQALNVYCKAVKLKPSPDKQEVVQEVPAMKPLPTDP
ncbi:MAG: carboxypeptidase-like regulatory domain-containing protein [Kofleriaceae bacterium]|nr:carboxypeptidase-like regulatory domain-containing protein [Kofleriaceae bacterium]